MTDKWEHPQLRAYREELEHLADTKGPYAVIARTVEICAKLYAENLVLEQMLKEMEEEESKDGNLDT